MPHTQKPYFVFRRNGRVHLNRRWRQFSRLLAVEVCASAVVIRDAPCFEVVGRVLVTPSIRQFPLHFPSRASPCVITFQLDSTIYPSYLSAHQVKFQWILFPTTAARLRGLFRVTKLGLDLSVLAGKPRGKSQKESGIWITISLFCFAASVGENFTELSGFISPILPNCSVHYLLKLICRRFITSAPRLASLLNPEVYYVIYRLTDRPRLRSIIQHVFSE